MLKVLKLEHVPCAGSETAFYPKHFCNAIHDGLDAYEAAQEEPKPQTHVKPFEALVPGCMSVPEASGQSLPGRPGDK